MIWIIYMLCVFYCVFKMYKSYVKRHGTDVIGTSPGLETLAIVALAPILTLVDVVMTWIRLYKDSGESKKNDQKIY